MVNITIEKNSTKCLITSLVTVGVHESGCSSCSPNAGSVSKSWAVIWSFQQKTNKNIKNYKLLGRVSE